VLFEEVQLPVLNSYKDKINTNYLQPTNDLLEERQKIIDDLVKHKQDLENEIKNNK
jgi:hypothetical protein